MYNREFSAGTASLLKGRKRCCPSTPATRKNAPTRTTSHGDDAAAPSGFRALPAKITSSFAPAHRRAPGSRQKKKPESLKKQRGQAHAKQRQRSRLWRRLQPIEATKPPAACRSEPRTRARLVGAEQRHQLATARREAPSSNSPIRPRFAGIRVEFWQSPSGGSNAMTSQDNGEPELWGRYGCIRGSRCCGGRAEADRDKSNQLDRDLHNLRRNSFNAG